jgi:hypothetical protein
MLAELDTVSPQDMGLPTAKAAYEELRLKHARLLGMRESLLRRKEELTLQVAQAKGRLALSEEVTEVFEALQEKAHRRSIGPYEDGLSACVRDVFPEKGGEDGALNGIVKLELSQHLGLPALDLYINNDGFKEDILTANGGSINNVVVAGLRVSALAQTDNRRLLVLDEPDIWIKPENVPNFVKMLSEVAEKSKTQMLMISHHISEYFEGHASIIKLYSDDGRTKATVLEPRMAEWESDDVPGVRYMHLINVRAHRDTFIPLMPGLNSFIGDNDLGKSTALISGFRAVAYNDADDTLFSHDRSANKDEILEAKIIIGLEQNKRIEYTRYLKKSPKVIYRIYEDETMVFEGRPPQRGQVPEKVEALLGIKRVDGLDIQLRSQKSPIFLLDETPAVRAKLLSVGRESGHFVAVTEAYRKLKASDTKTKSDGEAELTRLNAKLPILDRLVPLQAMLSIHTTLLKAIENAEQQEKLLVKSISVISDSKRLADACRLKRDLLARLPEAPPVLTDNRRLCELLTALENTGPRAGLELKPLTVTVPMVPDLGPLQATVERLAVLERTAAVELTELLLTVPALEDLSRLQTAADHLEALGKKAAIVLPELLLAAPWLDDTARLRMVTDHLDLLGRKAALVLPELTLVVPAIEDTLRLVEVGARLAGLQRKSDLLDRLPPVVLPIPVVHDNETLARQANRLARLEAEDALLAAQLAAAKQEEAEQDVLNAALKDEIGQFCPLCEGLLPEGGLVHAH